MRGLSIFVEHVDESRAPSRSSVLETITEERLEAHRSPSPKSLEDFHSWGTAPVFEDEQEHDFEYKTMSWQVRLFAHNLHIRFNGLQGSECSNDCRNS
jgi:hypothetical protein